MKGLLKKLLIIFLLQMQGCASYFQQQSPGNGFFKWPVRNAVLTQKFREDGDRHLGVDLAAKLNTPITASHAGIVVYAGSEFSGFGKIVLIENENGWATIYAHLNRLEVKTGQRVRQSQLIGLMGKTGRATGVHLHFEVRNNKDPIDPLDVFNTSTMPKLKYRLTHK